MIREVVVQQDTREKVPLLFPSTVEVWEGARCRTVPVKVERTTLDAGDYRLRDAPNLCVVERKGSVRELTSNLLGPDASRQARAFGRLRDSCRFPCLLIHVAASTLLTKTDLTPQPERLLQVLARCQNRFGLSICLVPQTSTSASRRITGTFVLHMLLGHWLNELDSTGLPHGHPELEGHLDQ